MMPHTMRFNRDHVAPRQAWIARILGRDVSNLTPERAADAAADAVEALTRDLGLPTRLRDVGVEPTDFDGIADDALQDLIVATNPRPIGSREEIIGLLQEAW